MERAINVRLPEVLAAKVDRFAQSEGMTQSELVRQALRSFFAATSRDITESISREIKPKLEAQGIREENAEEYYKSQQGKSPRKRTRVANASCA